MPAPLIWLGAAALGIYASNELNTAYLKRKGIIKAMPGDKASTSVDTSVAPENGSIVCCAIYGMLDHTGIWRDGRIYELNGDGLIRSISPNRFLNNRTGETIYVACGNKGTALSDIQGARRAANNLYQIRDYHLLKDNCHRFIAEMLTGQDQNVMSFSDLNQFLFTHFQQTISWHPANIRVW
ncbi:MAG: hypothetical protein AAGJ37_01955 [Pseudomonadota bacterium]